MNLTTPPIAAKIPSTETHHGITVTDDYAWLRDTGYPEVTDAEVLAHLDAENVFKFVSAFGKFSGFKQVAFVSHKPFVFKNADVLLGITKNQQANSASCYSFNLKSWIAVE